MTAYCGFCYQKLDEIGPCPRCNTKGSVQDLIKKVIPVSNVPAYDIMIPAEIAFVMPQNTKAH